MMNWVSQTLNKYSKNNSGSFTVFWALTLSTILMLVGAANDMNAATTAKAKAQSFADTIALTAAINVKANDGLPQSDQEGFVHNKTYNLTDIGFNIDLYVKADSMGANENGRAAAPMPAIPWNWPTPGCSPKVLFTRRKLAEPTQKNT